MSGQWEVVGKSKKDKQNGKSKKMSKNEKKKFVDNAPKVEDLLPLAQVKSLYAALDTNKEPPKPVEKPVKTKENETKKVQKKPKEKKDTMKETKPPKTIEAAVTLVTASEVQTVLEVGQLRFPEVPLVWLKGLASWLNIKLPIDHTDNTFTAKSWEYPLCLLSADTRALLKKAIREVPDSAIQMFYDYCLTSMANDMTKGSPVTGYKVLLQLVASQQPSVAVSDLGKCATVRHSYQNRPAIGSSVMWALGQAGFKDISIGLQVWQSVMFPVHELRHYTHFVSDYLKHLLGRHSTSKALTAHQYLEILDTVFSSSHANNFKAHLHMLQDIAFNVQSDDRLHNMVEPLLSRISLSSSPALKDELTRFLTECLVKDSQSWAVWRQLYIRHLPQSAVLLRHLNSEWSVLTARLPAKLLKDSLKTFKVTNDDMTKRKLKAEGLQECTRLCENMLSKMTVGKGFPWRKLSVVLILAIAGCVAFDINTHGSFKGSKSGTFLRNVGALSYGEQAMIRLKESPQQLYRWSEQNWPVYSAMLGPYLQLVADCVTALVLQVVAGVKLVTLYCLERKPVVEQWVSDYVPGFVEAASQIWDITRDFGLQVATLVLKYLSITSGWLQYNVFAGNLSAENLQRVTLEAFNTTQALAAQTFFWLSERVVPASSDTV